MSQLCTYCGSDTSVCGERLCRTLADPNWSRDANAALRTEIAALRAEVVALQALEMNHDGAVVRLRAENERLRVLLEHAHHCIRDAGCEVCGRVTTALRGKEGT
jgi:hypothetical protein